MSCPHIPELTYTEFGESLNARIAGRRVPISGTAELTERCNLDCAHCSINLPPDDLEARDRELSVHQWRDLLHQIAEEGCLSLLLTGGEPLLRPDFLDIYDYAKGKGFLITLFTNGTLVTPRIADHLADWPPLLIEVTLYGMSQETYERVTGVPGSYENCMRGIQLLHERDLPLKLKMVVMTLNRGEFPAVQQFARELTGDFRYDAVLKPRSDGSKDVLALRLPAQEVVDLDMADSRSRESFVTSTARHGAMPASDSLFTCGAAQRTFHVDAHGRLSPCLSVRFLSCDLTSSCFQEGWHGFLKHVRSQRVTREYECPTCTLRGICPSCPAFAQLENGDPETAVGFACRVAHLRAEAYHLHHEAEPEPLRVPV
ncbi:MAG: radical SAM protein, partial [Anaerolineae bacterium]|jgi:radical SAM protein with 4Fe4S-binding SPASM domain